MEFGIYGYKNDTYKRIFKNLNVNVEGILVGNNWDKIHYFKDVKKYIERIYKKKLYNFNEIDELINLIKKNS